MTKSACTASFPAGLHHQMKLMAFEGETDMTALVVDALENYVAEHRR